MKGNQVVPAELEALLLEHDGVEDAAVVGLNVREGSEKVRGFVVRQTNEIGKRLTEEDVMQLVSQNAVSYKWLTAGVDFIEAVPKNASGRS